MPISLGGKMKRSIRDLVGLEGKRILLRTDFNLPMNKVGRITDTTRVVNELPTIRYLVERGAKVIICSHLGRPKGFDFRLSLWPIALMLMKYFPGKVQFAHKVIGEGVVEQVASMSNGSILLLENVRFYKEETENDPEFAKHLASLADIYVNDAFGVAHRKHASTFGVARLLPNAIGFLMENEINTIEEAIKNPKKPFVAIFGGAKVQDKIKVILNIAKEADAVLIGGAMAYSFLVAQGYTVGQSLINAENVSSASQILDEINAMGKRLVLPIDHIAYNFGDKKMKSFETDVLSGDMVGADIGPKTVKLFEEEISKARQVVWNGPLGKYEDDEFKAGTFKIAKAIARAKAYSIVGGGDSVSAVKQAKCDKLINHISTGGGATLKLMSGESLPGIDVIQEKYI